MTMTSEKILYVNVITNPLSTFKTEISLCHRVNYVFRRKNCIPPYKLVSNNTVEYYL